MITFQSQPSESHHISSKSTTSQTYGMEPNQSIRLQTEDPLLEPPNLHQDWGQHQDQVQLHYVYLESGTLLVIIKSQ